jgi:hypothetical protein
MNKKLLSISSLVLLYFSSIAQKSDSYVLLNFSVPLISPGYGFANGTEGALNYLSSQGSMPLSLQWIKGKEGDKAIRYGIGIYGRYIRDYRCLALSGDTSNYMYKTTFIAVPMF